MAHAFREMLLVSGCANRISVVDSSFGDKSLFPSHSGNMGKVVFAHKLRFETTSFPTSA